jgi:Na+/pantothenate symporter
MPAATVGMALFMFLTPMAMVMFPKLVRSNVEGSDSRALQHALVGTAILGALAVLTLFLAPKLPLWVLYYKNPIYWQSDQLVSWYIAALYPLLLANILIGNLLAKEKLGAASCAALLLLAAGYAALLWGQSDALLKTTTQTTMDSHQFAPATQAAFQQIIKTFGASNLALLALSAALSWRVKTEKTIPPHSLSAEEEH